MSCSLAMACNNKRAVVVIFCEVVVESGLNIFISHFKSIRGLTACDEIRATMCLPVSWGKDAIFIKRARLVEDRGIISFYIQANISQIGVPRLFVFLGEGGGMQKEDANTRVVSRYCL